MTCPIINHQWPAVVDNNQISGNRRIHKSLETIKLTEQFSIHKCNIDYYNAEFYPNVYL